jgi:molecular chaperone DnaK (HSP70)
VQEHKKRLPVTIEEKDGVPVYKVASTEDTQATYTPIQVTSKFLARLVESASTYIGVKPVGYCVSVPVHFTFPQRSALMEAAKLANIPILQLVSEPAAACLAYHANLSPHDMRQLDKTKLVFDLGASSLEISVVAVRGGIYTILSSSRDTSIGGHNFDDVLLKHFAAEFKRNTGLDALENARGKAKLLYACEITKRTLSSSTTATCSAESVMMGRDFHASINRIRFEMLAKSLFNQCIDVTTDALKKAGISATQVDEVVFIGGSTRMPKLRARLRDVFQAPHTVFRTEIEPDEAIARGCAVQASLIHAYHLEDADLAKLLGESASNQDPHTLAPHLAKAIGVLDADGEFQSILKRDSPLPVRRVIKTKNADGQTAVLVDVYEGFEDELVFEQVEVAGEDGEMEETTVSKIVKTDKTRICQVVLDGLVGGEEIELQFQVDKLSELQVVVRDATNNRAVRCTVPPASA